MQGKARALLFLRLFWIFVHTLMQFSSKSHSFAVWGIQEMCTEMRACTWLSVCRTAATWGGGARLLGQGCVPGMVLAQCCEMGCWMHQTHFRQMPQNLSSALQWLLLSCPWGASRQLPSSQSQALEPALFPPHSITSAQTVPCVDSHLLHDPAVLLCV